MIPAQQRSHLEVAAIVVALVFGSVLLAEGLRLYARHGGLSADAAVPLYTAIPALAAVVWAVFVPHARRVVLAAGMLLPVGFLVLVGAPSFVYVAPVSVLLLLAIEHSERLQPTA